MMRVTLWGTRGSLASAGPETVRYGGNTACVEVRSDKGDLLILDAGTGLRRLGGMVSPHLRHVHILLTHLHMDHILGLGFFAPLFGHDLNVHIWGAPSTTQNLRGRLTRYLSPPLFPVNLRELPHSLTLHDVPLGHFAIDGFEIDTDLVCHPGPTVGYRITDGTGTLTYLPDHEPALGVRHFPDAPEWTSGFDLAAGADLLIHDAQYTIKEYEHHVGWGHSALPHALAFAGLAGVKRLVTFHHDPSHPDSLLDKLVEEACVSVHGANRLGTNSLVDILVFGRRAGRHMGGYLRQADVVRVAANPHSPVAEAIHGWLTRDTGESVARIRDDLQAVMMNQASVFRRGPDLEEALGTLNQLRERYSRAKIDDHSRQFNQDLLEALELGFLLDLADATVRSALNRTESRGAHTREDFPTRDDAQWLKHTLIYRRDGGVTFRYKPVVITRFQPKERKY